jgi:succinylarginine dihydrolase
VPLPRPNPAFLDALGLADRDPADEAERRLRAAAWSASAMWTANAATVSPAPDTPMAAATCLPPIS